MKKYSLLFCWQLTQLVKENTCSEVVDIFVKENFDKSYKFKIFKTTKDEVLQVYNNHECLTIIGGSSGDKHEWRSNFNVGKLVWGRIHRGFYNGAIEVLHHDEFIKRNEMMYIGHSRGGAISSVICDIRGVKGVGFGSPKAFKHNVGDLNFVNVRNSLDPVCHVVPFFKKVGTVVKARFINKPHTDYSKFLKKKGL